MKLSVSNGLLFFDVIFEFQNEVFFLLNVFLVKNRQNSGGYCKYHIKAIDIMKIYRPHYSLRRICSLLSSKKILVAHPY